MQNRYAPRHWTVAIAGGVLLIGLRARRMRRDYL